MHAFTRIDAEAFFAGWETAVRIGDPAWFEDALDCHFVNVVLPLAAVLTKSDLTQFVSHPRDLDIALVDLSISGTGNYAAATVLAHVREDPEDALPNNGRPDGSLEFLHQLAAGATVVYQTAWRRDSERWRCLHQTVLGVRKEFSSSQVDEPRQE